MGIGIIAIISLIAIWAFATFFRARWRKVHKKRTEFPKEQFVKHFRENGFKEKLIHLSYDKLCKALKIKQPKFYPDDNLHVMYMMTDDEVKDLLIELCMKLEVKYPKEKDWKAYKEQYGEITDFEGFVRYLQLRVDGEI